MVLLNLMLIVFNLSITILPPMPALKAAMLSLSFEPSVMFASFRISIGSVSPVVIVYSYPLSLIITLY